MNAATPASAQAGTPRRALGATEIVTQLSQHAGWSLHGDGEELVIQKHFEFANFHEVMGFANAVAWLANQRDHHPDMLLQYRRVTVRWRSHDAGGITHTDFECAALVDALPGC